MTPDDLGELIRLQEDPEVSRFMGSPSREWLEGWMRSSQAEWTERGHGRLAIFARKGGEFLGRSGLKYWPQFEETEIGWALQPEARGNGYATEAARAILEWGFERFPDLPLITAMIQPENGASIAVAERLGMSPLRSDKLLGDAVTVYAIRRGDRQ